MSTNYGVLVLSGRQWLQFWLCALAVGMAVGVLFYNQLRIGLVLTLCCGAAVPVYKKRLIKQRKAQLRMQFRDMLYSVSSSVSAGRTMEQALTEAQSFLENTYEPGDDIMLELHHMTVQMDNAGRSDIDVLRDFGKRSGLEEIREFVEVYENCKVTGGNLPRAIDRATTIISDEINLESELETLMAQKLFEGRIVALAPFAMLLMLRVTAPDYMTPLWSSDPGMGIVTFAVGLMALGLWMTERVNQIEI